ncbi:MAG: PHP domain-containing protein [Gemmatimonadetes bacterium]|nr:PHP domain-containing protein [Gemmatimonadota bacterium]
MSDRTIVEFHVHTSYSPDSKTDVAELEEHALSMGTECLAITDHDSIEGAVALRDRGRIAVIVGEEVTSELGDIIGLFLTERVPPGLSPAETIARIHDQGGLVYIPHPFDRRRRSRLFRPALEEHAADIDIIEAWNGRTRFEEDNERGLRFAEEHGKPVAYGSDAHLLKELGRARMEMAPFHDAPGFLDSLRDASRLGNDKSMMARLWNKLRGDD